MDKRRVKKILGYAGVALSLVFLGRDGLEGVLNALSNFVVR